MAVGGGSCCDYAKAVSVSVHCEEDPWEKYYIRFEEPSCEIVPVGCVLTMVGTGSEILPSFFFREAAYLFRFGEEKITHGKKDGFNSRVW